MIYKPSILTYKSTGVQPDGKWEGGTIHVVHGYKIVLGKCQGLKTVNILLKQDVFTCPQLGSSKVTGWRSKGKSLIPPESMMWKEHRYSKTLCESFNRYIFKDTGNIKALGTQANRHKQNGNMLIIITSNIFFTMIDKDQCVFVGLPSGKKPGVFREKPPVKVEECLPKIPAYSLKAKQ